MCPLVLHTRSLFDTTSPTPSSNMAQRVVFILCIVFGSLLVCILVALLVYFVRRRNRRKRDADTASLHRESSFMIGAPSVIDIAPPQPSRRPSLRTTTALPRLAIPSPELGSVFRFDLVRRGSSATSRPQSGAGLISTPKAAAPHYDSLFSKTSNVVASPEPEKYHVPLRVMNPSPLLPRAELQLQKPTPAYRAGFHSSRERLVSSTTSADSLFAGSTSTPPLSPPGTWSHPGTNTANSPIDAAPDGASVVLRKSLSQQTSSSLASPPPHIAVESFELSCLEDSEPTPRAYAPLSSSPPPGRWEPPSGVTGTPVTLSHFPFRFSAGAPSSPGLPSIVLSSPALNPPVPALSPRLSYSRLGAPNSLVYGLGLGQQGSQQSLPGHSTPGLKIKIKHNASDEIVAIAFAPQTINFQAVSDAVRGRLGFEPRKVLTGEGTELTNDAGLWNWLEEQYTKGHTRLMLHVE